MAAILTSTLNPYDSKTRGVLIEPHPLQWIELPHPTKAGDRFKVYAWRYSCTLCNSEGIGWPKQVSAEAQANDHAKVCPNYPDNERPKQ